MVSIENGISGKQLQVNYWIWWLLKYNSWKNFGQCYCSQLYFCPKVRLKYTFYLKMLIKSGIFVYILWSRECKSKICCSKKTTCSMSLRSNNFNYHYPQGVPTAQLLWTFCHHCPDICWVLHLQTSMAHVLLYGENQAQDHSPLTPGGSKNASSSIGIPLKRNTSGTRQKT